MPAAAGGSTQPITPTRIMALGKGGIARSIAIFMLGAELDPKAGQTNSLNTGRQVRPRVLSRGGGSKPDICDARFSADGSLQGQPERKYSFKTAAFFALYRHSDGLAGGRDYTLLGI